jgi:hypothetical protein
MKLLELLQINGELEMIKIMISTKIIVMMMMIENVFVNDEYKLNDFLAINCYSNYSFTSIITSFIAILFHHHHHNHHHNHHHY